jgi:hypothetical protein
MIKVGLFSATLKQGAPTKTSLAAINMDMYLPLFPLRYLEVQGLGEFTLGNHTSARWRS